MLRLLLVTLVYFICQTALAADIAPKAPMTSSGKANEASKSATATQKSYFQSLFDEVEVAKTTPADMSSKRIYDKLSKDSVAYGVLNDYPNLQMGDLEFRQISPTATHKPQVLQGQELIRKEFSTDKPLTYKHVTDIINSKMTDPNSSMKDMDWVLMSNAFRTLKAPGKSQEAHLLGDFLAEYILLAEIKKQESKTNLTNEDRSFLSTLYYDLSQVYKSMYKNEEKRFQEPRNGRLNLPIAPVYRGYEYPEPYDQGYDVIFDSLVGRHLDLLGNSLIFDPYDDLGWAQLIDFALFDLIDPWYYDEFYPDFWYTYFPFGITAYDVDRLRHKWHGIRKNTKHFKHLRQNGPGMNRALRKFSRAAGPKSRFNRTIHSAHSPSSFASQGKIMKEGSIAQGKAFPRGKLMPPTYKDDAKRMSPARADSKFQRKSSTIVSKQTPLKHHQSPQAYRGIQQHNGTSWYGRNPIHHGRVNEFRRGAVRGDTSFKYSERPNHPGPVRSVHSDTQSIKHAASTSTSHPQSPASVQGDKKKKK